MDAYKKDQSIEPDKEIQEAIQLYTILDKEYGPDNPAPKELSSILKDISNKYESLKPEPEPDNFILQADNRQLVPAYAGGKSKSRKQKQKKQSKRISHRNKNKTGTPKNRKNKKTGTRKKRKTKKSKK